MPIGGLHVTRDIADILSTPLAIAERLKTLYGTAEPSPDDEREMLTVQLIGEEEHAFARIPRSMVVDVITPAPGGNLRAGARPPGRGRAGPGRGTRVVLTGGASPAGRRARDGARILDRQVRLGRPSGLRGLAPELQRARLRLRRRPARLGRRRRPRAAELALDQDRPPGRLRRIVAFLRDRV